MSVAGFSAAVLYQSAFLPSHRHIMFSFAISGLVVLSLPLGRGFNATFAVLGPILSRIQLSGWQTAAG